MKEKQIFKKNYLVQEKKNFLINLINLLKIMTMDCIKQFADFLQY